MLRLEHQILSWCLAGQEMGLADYSMTGRVVGPCVIMIWSGRGREFGKAGPGPWWVPGPWMVGVVGLGFAGAEVVVRGGDRGGGRGAATVRR